MNEEKREITKEYQVSPLIKIGSYALLGMFVIIEFFLNLYDYSPMEIGFALGASIPAVIGFLIAFFCGNKCSEWATKIKKSPNIAFVVGFWAGLVGLVGYWIYYKIKS